MKIDSNNSDLPFSALYGLGLHNKANHTAQSTTMQHGENAAGKQAENSSSIKPVEPGGAAREDQALKNELSYSQQEKQIIDQMKARDREVRAHEAAHKAAAGSLAHGGAHFSYQSGPDGQRYAIGGEVNIDTAEVAGNPQATIVKAQIIRRAANAPAQPSSQDRSVAAMATQMEAKARQDISQERIEEQKAASVEKAEKSDKADNAKTTEIERRGQQMQSTVNSIDAAQAGELWDASV